MLGEIVELYKGTRIFNHSLAGTVPCLTRYMSAWAAAIDQLTWQKDILLIVAAGNLPLDGRLGPTRLSIVEHLAANRPYPDYLLKAACRIANPAQSFQALTVGSIARNYYQAPSYSSIAQKDMPSACSCSGLGIWDTIKPEVVEYGGNLVKDEDIFKWTLGKQKNHGKIKDVSRGAGTIQKDWTVVKSFELRESFCIAVVGHQGWNNDPDASVPYSLVVSFEAIQANVQIYQEISLAQVQMEVVDRVEIKSTGRI